MQIPLSSISLSHLVHSSGVKGQLFVGGARVVDHLLSHHVAELLRETRDKQRLYMEFGANESMRVAHQDF